MQSPFEVRLPTAGIRVVGEQGRMATFQFRCPTTNLDVCAFIDEVNGPSLLNFSAAWPAENLISCISRRVGSLKPSNNVGLPIR